jgi:hypothetical protein
MLNICAEIQFLTTLDVYIYGTNSDLKVRKKENGPPESLWGMLLLQNLEFR